MRWIAVALLAGCFAPRPPAGIACDPTNPACPDGQPCLPEGAGHVCGGSGIGVDALDPDGPPPDPFAYLALAPGYQVAVFQDFSAPFVYDAADWPEDTLVHDNQPDYLIALIAPYPEALGVLAGREILVLDGATFESHDFGNHVRNIAGQADHLTGAIFARLAPSDADLTLFVSSSSEDTGDGSFAITPSWTISTDLSINNARSILSDRLGAFDGGNLAQRYIGTQGGVIRRSDQVQVVPGDTRSMSLVGDTLYVTRAVPTGQRLIRVASVTHTETVLLERPQIRIAEGAPLPGTVAWAVIEERQLVTVDADGAIDVIADLVDPTYVWTSAVIPPPGHPLAGKIYILESHRGQDVDRVLALTPP